MFTEEQYAVHNKVFVEQSKLAQAHYEDEDQIVFTRKELKDLWRSLIGNADIRPAMAHHTGSRLVGHQVKVFYQQPYGDGAEFVQAGTLLDIDDFGVMFRNRAGQDMFFPSKMVLRIQAA